MQYIQLACFLVFLLYKSGESFLPQTPSSRGLTTTRLCYTYADVAERIATNAEQNVQVYHTDNTHTQNTRTWQSLIPLIPGERGCDVSVTWNCPKQGARDLLQHVFPNSQQDDALYHQVYESLQTFASLFSSHETKFKTRLVATRGISGTKCPRWHVDHVPKRWIQALVGPGCDYVVGTDGVQWDFINGMEVVESVEANLELVNEKEATIVHAKQGHGVVLDGAENVDGKFPAVHKSPTLGPLEGRVLLTIDVVRDNNE